MRGGARCAASVGAGVLGACTQDTSTKWVSNSTPCGAPEDETSPPPQQPLLVCLLLFRDGLCEGPPPHAPHATPRLARTPQENSGIRSRCTAKSRPSDSSMMARPKRNPCRIVRATRRPSPPLAQKLSRGGRTWPPSSRERDARRVFGQVGRVASIFAEKCSATVSLKLALKTLRKDRLRYRGRTRRHSQCDHVRELHSDTPADVAMRLGKSKVAQTESHLEANTRSPSGRN